MMSETMKSSPANNLTSDSDILIESFLHARSGNIGTLREAWFARQTMLSLVRLVRSEQLLAIKRSVRKLVPDAAMAASTKLPKTRRSTRKQPGQTQLAFGRED
jgi:hypothetical protein